MARRGGHIFYIEFYRYKLSFYILLAHISLASFLWDIGKQYKTRSDAANTASDQVVHCLLTQVCLEI